jgi:hypothetical protein
VAALPCKDDVLIGCGADVVKPVERLMHLLDVLLSNTNGQLAIDLGIYRPAPDLRSGLPQDGPQAGGIPRPVEVAARSEEEAGRHDFLVVAVPLSLQHVEERPDIDEILVHNVP